MLGSPKGDKDSSVISLGFTFFLQLPELFLPASSSLDFKWCWLLQLRYAHGLADQDKASTILGHLSCFHFCYLLPETPTVCNVFLVLIAFLVNQKALPSPCVHLFQREILTAEK